LEVQQDFKELLELLKKHKVEHIIIGAYALAFHGSVRYTGDIDILVNPDLENAKRIIAALEKFGFGSLGLKTEDFTSPDEVVQLGYPPVRIDILTSITGVSWEEAYENSAEGKYGDIGVRYIGKKELIINKRALGRKKDLADIESLTEE